MAQKLLGVFGARVDANLGLRIAKILSRTGEKPSDYVRTALRNETDMRESNIETNTERLKRWEKEAEDAK